MACLGLRAAIQLAQSGESRPLIERIESVMLRRNDINYIRLGQTRLEKSRMYLAGTTYRNLEKGARADVLRSEIRLPVFRSRKYQVKASLLTSVVRSKLLRHNFAAEG